MGLQHWVVRMPNNSELNSLVDVTSTQLAGYWPTPDTMMWYKSGPFHIWTNEPLEDA